MRVKSTIKRQTNAPGVHEQNQKAENIRTIFRLIGENRGISRASIARMAALSRATVSILTEEILRAGLIRAGGVGKLETAGRKPTMLEVDPDYAQIATVVLTQSRMRFVLYDMTLRPLEQFEHAIVYRHGFADDVLGLLAENARLLDWSRAVCLCLSVSSTILADTCELLSTVMDIAPGYNFLPDMRAKLPDVPIFASNGSPMLAYAEKCFGAWRDLSNLVYINLAEGLGAGIVMDGRVFKGAFGRAGEFGHISVDMDGPVCACGNRGCIDCFLKKTAILEAFREGCACDSALGRAVNGREITYDDIRAALDAGDVPALMVACRLADKLALAISNLICIFNPERIVLGGGIEALGDMFFSIVRSRIMASASRGTMWARRLALSYATPLENAENLGAAKYFLDHIYRYPFPRQAQLFL